MGDTSNSDFLEYVQSVDGTSTFTSKAGKASVLFWGPTGSGGRQYAIFGRIGARGQPIQRIENVASANASARATTIIAKGVL